ncbi:MAG: CHAD domain-containing protein [Ignavibacteriae bacterium]|nr:CHAD domain-containing protein [Ignavibacteriota bacterium]
MPRRASSARTKRSPAITVLLLTSLEQRWKKYQREMRRCRHSFSEDAIHDLRVATRRLVSTLIIIEILIPDERVRKMRRRLKRLFDAMSPLRDVQVQLLRVEESRKQFPRLATLATVLKVRERNLIRSLERKIMKVDLGGLGQTVRWLKLKLSSYAARRGKNQIALTTVVGSAASTFASATYLREQVIATQPRTIHRARIGFKKLRYTLEALAPFLPGLDKKRLKAMDSYQTRMGLIQDMEVFIARVRGFIQRQPPTVRRSLAPYLRSLLAEKKKQIDEYRQKADELYAFARHITHTTRSTGRNT